MAQGLRREKLISLQNGGMLVRPHGFLGSRLMARLPSEFVCKNHKIFASGSVPPEHSLEMVEVWGCGLTEGADG